MRATPIAMQYSLSLTDQISLLAMCNDDMANTNDLNHTASFIIIFLRFHQDQRHFHPSFFLFLCLFYHVLDHEHFLRYLYHHPPLPLLLLLLLPPPFAVAILVGVSRSY